ncbi:MAG: tetratricopeptide repeat protein [Pseudomonadota bacterium]
MLSVFASACMKPPLEAHSIAKSLPSAEAHLEQGHKDLKQADYASAKFHFLSVINQNGPQDEALVGLGMIEEAQNHLFEAERFFRKAIAISDTSVSAYNNLGVVLFRQESYHEAREAFRLAFALSSGTNDTAVHNLNLADLAVAQADHEQFGTPIEHQLLRTGSNEYLLQSREAVTAPDEQESEG